MTLILFNLMVQAEGVLPLGSNQSDPVVASTTNGESIYTITYDNQKVYHLNYWNGLEWTDKGTIKDLPKHGENGSGEFTVRDIIWFNNNLYLLGDFYISSGVDQSDMVYLFDGTGWSDISDDVIRNSRSLNRFVVLNNKLSLVGIFESLKSNLIQWDGNSWSAIGSWLTYNPNKDYIIDAEVYNGKLYVSGQFTRVGATDPYFTAVLENDNWNSVLHPPFLNGSYYFASTTNGLVLTGFPFGTDIVQRFNGAGWDNLSDGLENVSVNEFWDVVADQNSVYISGSFHDNNVNKDFYLMKWDGKKWDFIYWPEPSGTFKLIQSNNNIYLVGDFEIFGIQNIAQLSSGKALLRGLAFEDLNGNCLFDVGEPLVKNEVVRLNPGNHMFWTNNEGAFNIPVELGNYEIDFPSLRKYEASCKSSNVQVSANENGNYEFSIGLARKSQYTDLKVESGFANGYYLIDNRNNSGMFKITNNGNAPIKKAQFDLESSDMWSEVSFNPPYDIYENGHYIWLINDLGIDEVFTIQINGKLKSGYNESLLLKYNAIVINPEGDDYSFDNQNALTFEKGEPLPPIYKQCGNGSYIYEEQPLNYNIRFQNVGNTVVHKVTLKDTLDSEIWIGSKGIEYLTSHDGANLKSDFINKGNNEYCYVLTWVFNDINLQDSSTDFDKSVGFVQMNINLDKGRHPNGTVICNDADLQFDNQEPYVTNEVCAVVSSIGVSPDPIKSTVSIYPNPSSDIVHIRNLSNADIQISVLDINGKVVIEQNVKAGDTYDFSSSGWSKGVYLVKVDGYECHKLILH
ncbi:MAG: T9SS type A sorting domain-containing protein [Bacteroidetes bacterium]|nr:T9SS type A sorting domain-containing protein [Bacteroidota bacterium]